MKFVNKIIKSKYFGPIVSVILVLLAMYVLYRLFNNATEGMYGQQEGTLKDRQAKVSRALAKIQQLGPQKIQEMLAAIPNEVSIILKEEGLDFRTLYAIAFENAGIAHNMMHNVDYYNKRQMIARKLAKKQLEKDIKQYGAQKYYDSGELIYYSGEGVFYSGENVFPDYKNRDFALRVMRSWKDVDKSGEITLEEQKSAKDRGEAMQFAMSGLEKEMSTARERRAAQLEREREREIQNKKVRDSTRPQIMPPIMQPTTQPSFVIKK